MVPLVSEKQPRRAIGGSDRDPVRCWLRQHITTLVWVGRSLGRPISTIMHACSDDICKPYLASSSTTPGSWDLACQPFPTCCQYNGSIYCILCRMEAHCRRDSRRASSLSGGSYAFCGRDVASPLDQKYLNDQAPRKIYCPRATSICMPPCVIIG
ncbi:uncharacterized protein B0I36DRAFT_332306 [Microdochium trichocladiopsis]|uniref:Uncharacterized protein n=1 Tax=Microdochium trichocladiopsis TaxID=1682393 RepID=A0A9P8XY70_9PEZI|nr:uncharacterized protein B0I36DRAFT_332306 [Microdochium trichocladiopsis]KAH7024962.1 hypothetical protein B0I36DRAFT_332306 [Microdochium trichocladiopsis]